MSPADKIALYFPSIKIFRVFCQKEDDLLPYFHKMLEGLKHQSIKDDSKVCNIHRINFKELISRVPLHQATTDESEIIPVPQLKEKFSSTNLRSKKLTILTVLSQSWTLPKIQEQFGVTRCLHL